MGIKEKLQELGLPLDFADGNFAATINLIDVEEAKKIKNYFSYYGVAITKASELKYYTFNEMELKVVLAKLQFCKNNGISVVDEQGNNKSFIFELSKKNSKWTTLYPNADLTSIIPDVLRDKETLEPDMLATLNKNVTVGLTEDNYDRYVSLETTMAYVMQTLNIAGEITPEISNNLIKLISAHKDESDSKILFAALAYNQNRSAEELEIMRKTINEVIESLNQGGSRAL